MRLGFDLKKNVKNNHTPPSRLEKVADYLEALIDPFDLDVFTPHLNSNLNRLVQRTSVSHRRAQHERRAGGSDGGMNPLQPLVLWLVLSGGGRAANSSG